MVAVVEGGLKWWERLLRWWIRIQYEYKRTLKKTPYPSLLSLPRLPPHHMEKKGDSNEPLDELPCHCCSGLVEWFLSMKIIAKKLNRYLICYSNKFIFKRCKKSPWWWKMRKNMKIRKTIFVENLEGEGGRVRRGGGRYSRCNWQQPPFVMCKWRKSRFYMFQGWSLEGPWCNSSFIYCWEKWFFFLIILFILFALLFSAPSSTPLCMAKEEFASQLYHCHAQII